MKARSAFIAAILLALCFGAAWAAPPACDYGAPLTGSQIQACNPADAPLSQTGSNAAFPLTPLIATRSVTIPAAQLLALAETPVTLIPAVPGHVILLIAFYAQLNFVTTPYVVNTAPDIYYGTTSDMAALYFVNLNWAQTSTTAYTAAYGGSSGTPAQLGQAITLYTSADLTEGDGTLTIQLWYIVK